MSGFESFALMGAWALRYSKDHLRPRPSRFNGKLLKQRGGLTNLRRT